MRFYTVSDRYITFLQSADSKVPNNGGAGYKNPKAYIGVILEVGGHTFLAPLSSYKQQQDRIQASSVSALKLHERTNPDNKLGLIAFNYMIPVPDSELSPLDIESQDDRYKRMLYLQFEFIKTNQTEISRRAAKLYEHVVIKRSDHFVRISCDFTLLIDRCKQFQAQLEEK